MARLSINEVTTYRWTFEEDVTQYAEAGIQAIGVWRQKLTDFGEEKGIELLAEMQMAVSNLSWIGGFTGADGRGFRDSLEDAAEAIRIAAALKTGTVVVYTGPRGGHTHNHARRLITDALKELAPQAAEHKITLALEPMHPDCAAEWTFLTSLDDACALMDKVDSPALGLVFDTYHLGHDPAVIEQIPAIVDRIRIVQLADRKGPPDHEQERTRLGTGEIPLKELVGALRSAGYDGDFDVELFGDDIAANDYRETLEQSQKVFAELLG